ncbi:long chain acyl-coa elongase [Thraustotheca clavata]|uniref:Elongation of fatty acids protein n=1 Tax=Thraustotheca clavata TaxID=74557 RepID=A0A1W0ABE9_9STRA|nr:long chain acyl-coa elongase [Thraustotheca clavata]
MSSVLEYYDNVVAPFFVERGLLVPIGAVALYLAFSGPICRLMVQVFNLAMSEADKKAKKRGAFVTYLSIVHNTILAVYSGWTFINTAPIFYKIFSTHGFMGAVCDRGNDTWPLMGWWVTHFYISKYYEFVDSWIVYLKGDKPIFLQTFHHAGIVITMYTMVITESAFSGMVTTTFNSFIHTIMYTYYLFAVLGYRSPYAKYLTMAQLTQFLVGISISIPSYFQSGCLNTDGKFYSLAFMHLYTVILIFLFYRFFRGRYKKVSIKKD